MRIKDRLAWIPVVLVAIAVLCGGSMYAVQTVAMYNATTPTFANGSQVPLQTDQHGVLNTNAVVVGLPAALAPGGGLKSNGSSVFATFAAEYANTVTTAAALTTFTTSGLSTARLGVICTNTGAVDVWV